MKKVILSIALTFLVSFSASAWESVMAVAGVYGVTEAVLLSRAGTYTTYGTECDHNLPCKEAVQIINDSQDYIQSGELTLLLTQKIKDAQTLNDSLSEMEALEEVISNAVGFFK